MKKVSILISVFFFCFSNLYAQKHKLKYISIAATTLHTDFPFGSFSELFTKEFHPGIEIGTGFNWKTKQNHDWFQTIKVGYSYQRFVQHTIPLYTEFGYRYKFFKTFSAEASVGAGYLHAISAEPIFVLQDDGSYEKKPNLGKPQAMGTVSFAIDKKISSPGANVFLNYQQRIQFPFIKSYVPLLPANIIMLGIRFPF